jgi:hypothetical protein
VIWLTEEEEQQYCDGEREFRVSSRGQFTVQLA